MPTPRETILSALLAALQTVPSATALRSAILPERIPTGGLLILRDGDPGTPEVTLSPLQYHYEHRAEVEVIVQGKTPERLRAMGNNGVLEPVTGYKDGKLIGTERLYSDGTFGTGDGKARFCAAGWRGWQAAGKEAEQKKFKYWINNGRANIFWQNQFLDQDNDFIQDRFPFPFIEMNPADMADLGVSAGDLVEIHNDNGSTQAMAYPTPTARPGETLMVFGSPSGSQGNVTNPGVNELVLPDYKHTWANIRKLADAPASTRHVSFKSKEYTS